MAYNIKDGQIYWDAKKVEFNTIKIQTGENKMDKETKEKIAENVKMPLYIVLSNTLSMNEHSLNLQYTVSKVMVAECLANNGLVFELKDGKLEPVTSITVP